jgi:hypothetical protein
MLAQQEVAFAAAKRRIGQSFEVVVDGPAERESAGSTGRILVARHAGQAPDVDAVCLLSVSDVQLRLFELGAFLTVRCVGTASYDLIVDRSKTC